MNKPHPSVVAAAGRASLLTYEPYYGLREKPFSLSGDPRFLYKTRTHAPIFDDLLAGIRRREGLIVLTGDIGTGKTTLCRAVLERLDRKTFSTFVPDPFLSREDLLKIMLVDFGVMSVDDLKSGRYNGASRAELSYPLYEFLNSLSPLQAFAVLIIDEAQNLSVPLLEEIRILSDLEAPEKLLQVVLVGQLELREKLKLPEMRQVDQRVSVRCELEALELDAVAGYIAHRLAVAGGGRDRVEFSSDAVDLIYSMSGGVPRLINLICDRSLHHGYLSRSSRINGALVGHALVDLGLREREALPEPEEEKTDDLDLTEMLTASTGSSAAEFSAAVEFPAPEEREVAAPVLLLKQPRVRFHRRRFRRLFAWAALPLLVLLAAGAGATYWQAQISEPSSLPPLPKAPVFSVDPAVQELPMHVAASVAIGEAAVVHSIDVALFRSAARSNALVEQLTVAGINASVVRLESSGGLLLKVTAGPYILRADADADLKRIREIPGYGDARIAP